MSQAAAEVTVLDIRTPSLYASGWIDGCVKIPLASLTERYREIPNDKPVVVVDHSGHQTQIAGRFLFSMGYRAETLEGGLKSWVLAKLPLAH